ncbi:MAG: hypothetical protein CBARDCOR_6619 [uncultured Caballeronia sp.]|nr:MAG: hypothetical protein CBARDCOR_6619 [uncultured Caballeronia sp.]
MSISAFTDFITVSDLIGSALYDGKNRENFSQGRGAHRGIAQKSSRTFAADSVRTS